VLLLSANQFLVAMSAESLALIHRARGLSTRILDQKHQYFLQENRPQDMNGPSWQHAITQLDSMLASMKIVPNSQLKIILASDFVRYLSLPAQQVHMNAEEKLAYAIAAYREVYGSSVDVWDLKLNNAAPRQLTIAAAVDKTLLQALIQLAAKYQLKLVSVQPYLMSAFNALSSQIKNATGYLVIVELKRLLLINLQAGHCQNLRAFSLNNNWQIELKNLLARELLMADSSNPELYIYAPMQKNMALDTINDWQLKRIDTKNNTFNNPHMAMLEAML
jgi:hypothetical protein